MAKEQQSYKLAFDFAIQQRDALRKMCDELKEANYKHQCELHDARMLASKYFIALKALDALPESECLPWEVDADAH